MSIIICTGSALEWAKSAVERVKIDRVREEGGARTASKGLGTATTAAEATRMMGMMMGARGARRTVAIDGSQRN